MKCVLGKKIGMTQIFDDKGQVIPVTLLHVEPCTVVGKRTKEKDGYSALILASGSTRNCPPSRKGQFAKIANGLKPRNVSEFRCTEEEYREFEIGSMIDVSNFEQGDRITIQGVSKGKGFAGVVKRHHFKGSQKTHGHKHDLRKPGAIGSGFPQHVRKGLRMAGRMGSDRTTIQDVSVVQINCDEMMMAIKGCVPGSRGTIIRCYQNT